MRFGRSVGWLAAQHLAGVDLQCRDMMDVIVRIALLEDEKGEFW